MPFSACDWSLDVRSEEHTSELQSRSDLVCRLLLEKHAGTVLTVVSHAAALCAVLHFPVISLCHLTARPPLPIPLAMRSTCSSSYCFIFFFKDSGAPGILPFSTPPLSR